MRILSSLTAAIVIGTSLITANANPLANQYFYQGVEKYKVGNFQGAIDDYTRAIEINPQYAAAYQLRGSSKSILGDIQGAIADYTKVIEIDPQDANAYQLRGIAREKVNDLEGACRDWRKAVNFGQTTPAEWVKNQC